MHEKLPCQADMAATVPRVRCTLPFAPIAAARLACPSSRVATSQSIAATAMPRWAVAVVPAAPVVALAVAAATAQAGSPTDHLHNFQGARLCKSGASAFSPRASSLATPSKPDISCPP
jgi:hypothetical protein